MLKTLSFLVTFTILVSAQKVEVQWDKVQRTFDATPTFQIVVNPPLRPGSPIHDRTYKEVQRLGADYVRYVPWLPYPKLGVAELEPPTKDKTFWDFSLIDPMTQDFFNATEGHPVMLNFSTIPAWMFKTDKPVPYPANPDEPTWTYTSGTELRDPTLKELGDYYARLVSWYTNGGFKDELGVRHESGHDFKIAYWEILNEPDLEHNTTPEQYTARYDAIAAAIHKVSPTIKFVGVSLASPGSHPDMFEYFLNPKNHKPGIPLDMISYHFYAVPTADQNPETQQYTFFDQADGFLNTVRYIELIRKRLSPKTTTDVNELGCIAASDMNQGKPGYVAQSIPDSYWNLCAAVYAYTFANLALQGIDIVGESQLVGYPTQFPSVSLVDWNTGAPNARFRILELLKSSFRLGNNIAVTKIASPFVFAMALTGGQGEHKLLLVNKRDREFEITLPGRATSVEYVDQTTHNDPPVKQALTTDKYTLRGFAVAVVNIE